MPDNREIFTISNFAKFSRTTRDALIHYDRIGLLRPEKRGKNGYRLYSPDQLAVVNLIHTCQALGMPLAEIRALTQNRTPGQIYDLLGVQIERIDQKIGDWDQAKKLLSHFKNIIKSAIGVNTDEITVECLPAERILMGGWNDYSHGRNDYDALLSFYQTAHKKYPGLDMNYPVWGYFTEERLKRGDWFWPDHYYFSNPEGPDQRPAAYYAIGYGKGGYGNNDALYKRLTAYIESNGYEICGPSYEEYPLNEISVSEASQYLVRAMVMVRLKEYTPALPDGTDE